MSLTASLFASTSGLRTAERGLEVISRNIAGANTPGYTRKIQTQETIIRDGEARGVLPGELQRRVDAELQGQLRIQSGAAASLDIQDRYLSRVQALFGEIDADSSVRATFDRVETAFTELQANPDSGAAQNGTISAAQGFAREMNRMTDELTRLRQQAEDQIAGTVATINDKVTAIDDLNDQITRQLAEGRNAPDLKDQRDRLINELSELADITHFTDSNGAVMINIGNGQALLDQRPHALTFDSQRVSPQSKYDPPQTFPTGAPNLGGLELDGRDIAPTLDGGELGGLFTLRDQALPQAQAQLDEAAGAIVKAFEGQGLDLFVDPSNAPPHPHPDPETVGLAGRVEVNQNVIDAPWRLRDGTAAPGESATPSDTTLIDNVLDNVFEGSLTFRTSGLGPGATPDLASGLSGTATPSSYLGELIGFQATQKADIAARKEIETSLRDDLGRRLESESGVNIDEEMARLIQLENAYSASARSIQTVQRMFDALVDVI